MTATITVILKVEEDVLLVPNGAVKRQGGTTYAEVVKDDGTVEQHTIPRQQRFGTNYRLDLAEAKGADETGTAARATASAGTTRRQRAAASLPRGRGPISLVRLEGYRAGSQDPGAGRVVR
jgi:hypothetical protein